MTVRDLSPRLSLETVLTQEPTKRTSLLKLFCPSCGQMALTEKDAPGIFRVSCGGCRKASVVQFAPEDVK
jgi:ribosomal protein S27AE